MKQYAYKKVDAFTDNGSMGNPAAFLLLGDATMSSEEYLRVGKEHAGFVSEVVFCSTSKCADYKLTYYSSECEVDFCGHGTIATMYDLIKTNPSLREKEEVRIETNKKGSLTIYNHIHTEDAIYITAPDPNYLTVPVSQKQIADALGIDQALLSDELNMDFIDAGLRTLLVPIAEYSKTISIYPNEASLKTFCLQNGIDIILIFSKEASSPDYIAHTRVFAPKFGYLEDPATGSGNSAFGYYLLKNHLWDGTSVSIEQGGDNIQFNTVKLRVKDQKVLFGGRATLRIEGQYYL